MTAPRARLLRLAFHLLYNELAWTYDAVSWVVSLGQWRRWQCAALPYLPPAGAGRTRVLELAHGPGHMLLALHRAGYEVVGCDLSPAMGRLARRRLARGGASVPLVRGRAEALPFAAEAFDAVLATFPAEFIAAPETLRSVRRMLQPGGRFVLVPVARLTGSDPLSRALEWLYAVTGQRLPPEAEPRALVPLTEPLAAAGYAVRVEEIDAPCSRVTVVIAEKLP